MPVFLNTLGNSTLGIGICDRCKRKFPLGDLQNDRNNPGLKVCDADNDEYDPWRLPALQDDRLVLPFTRPDEPLTVPQEQVVVVVRVTEDEEYRVTNDESYRRVEE